MSDDLMLPQVPEPVPEDPEDVSWALSTAEAMWARGDHAEGIKWVRRAAEAASEAENDTRALELAKAAADLTGLITRRMSHASIDIDEIIPISEAAPAPPLPSPAVRPAMGKPPPAPKAPGAAGQIGTKGASRPPAPLPSRTSQPPGARASQAPGARGKPLGTNTTPSKPPPSIKGGGGAKKSRRSRENLDAEARAAGINTASDTSPQPAVDEATAINLLPSDTAETAAIDVPLMAERLRQRRAEDPTVASNVNDILATKAQGARPPAQQPPAAPSPPSSGRPESREMGKSTDEWDASPTQNLAGEELPFPHFPAMPGDGDRMTAVGPAPKADFKTTQQSFPRPAAGRPAVGPGALPPVPSQAASSPPTTVAATGLSGGVSALTGGVSSRAPRVMAEREIEKHDPGIMTTQAVRVVVWRDANGVHVAPAGTVVSAITVEAVLVALEPHADLTAWLSATK